MEKTFNNLGASSPEISFFRAPISNTRPHKNIRITDAFRYITSEYAKDRTEALRAIGDPRQARAYKVANFDYVTFCGTFASRSDKAIIQESGLLCIDFDHVPNLEDLFQKLLQDPYFDTAILFRSPSGDGLKWVIESDRSDLTQSEYFRAVSAYITYAYGIEPDKSGKDLSRACFLPFDPSPYLNPKYSEDNEQI